MGLFDGVREAFSAPALERSTLDAERETPIDRWMGWSVVSENSKSRTDGQGMFVLCRVGLNEFSIGLVLDDVVCVACVQSSRNSLCYVIGAHLSTVPVDFIDSMDESNYVVVELEKPMGIVFEENDEKFGGIFVQSLKEDGLAAQQSLLQDGDQLVAVNRNKVGGLSFDDALGAIVASNEQKTQLIFFRGTAKQFYGPTGPSQKWLDEFVAKGGSSAPSSE
jgi:hypothetical protein